MSTFRRAGRLAMWESPDFHVSDADGSDTLTLAPDTPSDRFPRWSPDGRRIAFTSMKSGTMETWTIAADGSELRRLTHFDRAGV